MTSPRVLVVFERHLDAEVEIDEHFPGTREEAHDPNFVCYVRVTVTLDFGGQKVATFKATALETDGIFGQNKTFLVNSCLLAVLKDVFTTYAGQLESKLGGDRVDEYGEMLVLMLDAARSVVKGPIHEFFGLSVEDVKNINLRDRLTSSSELLDDYNVGDYPEFYDLQSIIMLTGIGGQNVNSVLMTPIRYKPTKMFADEAQSMYNRRFNEWWIWSRELFMMEYEQIPYPVPQHPIMEVKLARYNDAILRGNYNYPNGDDEHELLGECVRHLSNFPEHVVPMTSQEREITYCKARDLYLTW